MSAVEGFETYETPYDTMSKIKHAIKIAATMVRQPMAELKPDILQPLVALEDIEDHQCRWPITETHWCGRGTDGSVYCGDHHARAIQKPLPARVKS